LPPIVAAIACGKLHDGIIRERRIKRLLAVTWKKWNPFKIFKAVASKT
jgi:hypothetical protein